MSGLALPRFPPSKLTDSLPVIKASELRSGITRGTGRASRDFSSNYVVRDGDFLFSWSGSLLTKFRTGSEEVLNLHLFRVTFHQYPMWFSSQWICHHLEEFQTIAASRAAKMGHIQRGHLKQAMTICPPDGVLTKLDRTTDPLVNRTMKDELEYRALVQIRDLLLPRFIGGELSLPAAVKALEAAT